MTWMPRQHERHPVRSPDREVRNGGSFMTLGGGRGAHAGWVRWLPAAHPPTAQHAMRQPTAAATSSLTLISRPAPLARTVTTISA